MNPSCLLKELFFRGLIQLRHILFRLKNTWSVNIAQVTAFLVNSGHTVLKQFDVFNKQIKERRKDGLQTANINIFFKTASKDKGHNSTCPQFAFRSRIQRQISVSSSFYTCYAERFLEACNTCSFASEQRILNPKAWEPLWKAGVTAYASHGKKLSHSEVKLKPL